MRSIIHFFKGSVQITVTGAYPERFLNLCAGTGISFWGMTRRGADVIEISVSVHDYPKLRGLAKKTMCRLHVVKKSGAPFLTKQFRRRSMFVAGLVIFCLIAWVLSSFVWVIDIEGYDRVNLVMLKQYLRQNGVYVGAYVPSVEIDSLKNSILLSMPELSFITVNFHGSRAEVQIRERTPAPEIQQNQDDVCDIVAARAGIIESIVVKTGTAVVKPGDTVVVGQVLAEGQMTGRAGSVMRVRADAQVRASVWNAESAVMPVKTLAKIETEGRKMRNTLVIAGKRIKLYVNGGISYKEYGKIVKQTSLTIGNNIVLPIALERAVYTEYDLTEYSIPQETVFEYLSGWLKRRLVTSEGSELIGETYDASVENGVARVTMTAVYEEEIGVERLISKGA